MNKFNNYDRVSVIGYKGIKIYGTVINTYNEYVTIKFDRDLYEKGIQYKCNEVTLEEKYGKENNNTVRI